MLASLRRTTQNLTQKNAEITQELIIGIFDDSNVVETHCNASLQQASLPNINNLFTPIGGNYKNEFGPQRNNLSSIIRGFKGSVKKQINEKYGGNFFSWQSQFYDHIIRNEISLNKIRKYIIDNPFRWHLDKNNPEGLWM
ncbi:MAG: hypothetical protein ABIC82_03650 [bacterium]